MQALRTWLFPSLRLAILFRMTRFILTTIVLLIAAWILLAAGVLPAPVAAVVEPILGVVSSFAIPILLLTAYLAPGLIQGVAADISHFWRRLRTRKHDIEELERKIVHLDRAYHIHQLGVVYLQQGRIGKAEPLFAKALEKDPDSLDAKYHLACCHFAQKHYDKSAELLEQVHSQKPEHDYGMAYLRLAQSQQFLGNASRAGEVYRTMLRYYPAHPEGTYHYALLLAGDHSPDNARQLMQEVIFTVRHSPSFHRRRNRHWALKARWWLWRNRSSA
jgi:tetratricopeptide (TPR) repeat protein